MKTTTFLLNALLIVCLLPTSATSILEAGGVASIASSASHSAAVRPDGQLLTWGSDYAGQLGSGRTLRSALPVKVGGLPAIKAVFTSPSANTGFAVSADGNVWGWGANDVGQLGDATGVSHAAPARLAKITAVQSIAASRTFTTFLKADGTAWSVGANDVGQLGDGNVVPRVGFFRVPVTTPVKVAVDRLKLVVAGYAFALGLRDDGTVWSWGENTYGQLGDGTNLNHAIPKQIEGLKNIRSLSVSDGTAMAVDANGEVWMWGEGRLGQAGDGTTENHSLPVKVPSLNNVVVVAMTTTTSIALKNDGTVWRWGKDIGLGIVQVGGIDQATSITTGGFTLIISATDGRHWASGSGLDGQFGNGEYSFYGAAVIPVTNLPDMKMIVGGYGFALGLKSDGSVWAWGSNEFAQLGDGQSLERPVPTVVDGVADVVMVVASDNLGTMVVKKDGTVWATVGISINGHLADKTGFARVVGLENIVAVAAGTNTRLALRSDGTVWGWGSNHHGQLGEPIATDIETPRQISGIDKVKMISAGFNFGLAIRNDGTLWSWGENTFGQLGSGSAGADRPVPAPVLGISKVIAVSAGDSHSIAVTADNQAWSWGSNNFGELGLGNFVTTAAPAKVLGGNDVSDVAAGNAKSYILKKDGYVSAFGLNFENELGLGLAGGPNPKQMPVLSHVVRITPNLALKDSGILNSWGGNHGGQAGNGTFAPSYVPGPVVGVGATSMLDLNPDVANDPADALPYLLTVSASATELAASLTDPRATGFDGSVYFTGFVPTDSPLAPPKINGFADSAPAVIPVTFGRGGVKQTGPGVPGIPAATGAGAISVGNIFQVYGSANTNPLQGSNVVICVGITVPSLSAKGQVLMRPIANGNKTVGVTQCPTVQTEASLQLYRGSASGTIDNLTLVATITPQPEDRGQKLNLYSWAVAPDGTQFMQTGPNQWSPMQQPMQPAQSIVVPSVGDISLPVVEAINLRSIAGTLVYVGMGASWDEVKLLNKAGHYYTVQ